MGFAGESEVRPFGENRRRHGTVSVLGRERFSSFIRRPFSPKHGATNQQDRPTIWVVGIFDDYPRKKGFFLKSRPFLLFFEQETRRHLLNALPYASSDKVRPFDGQVHPIARA